MFGHIGRLLFVDLSNREIEIRPLDEKTARNFIGGPGLGAKILYDEMPAKVDAYDKASMIGFVCGAMTGTPAFFSGRFSVVSKSPVYGGWNDANCGGYGDLR